MTKWSENLTVQVKAAGGLTSDIVGDEDRLFCRVAQIGPVQCYVQRTSAVQVRDGGVTWNEPKVTVPPIRGLTFQFEVYKDIDQGKGDKGKKIAMATFAPHLNQAWSANADTTKRLELFLFRSDDSSDQGGEVVNGWIDVIIYHKESETWDGGIYCDRPRSERITRPVYVSLNTDNVVRLKFSKKEEGKEGKRERTAADILPYTLEYELSVAMLNEKGGNYEYLCTSNRTIDGAWHSGRNLCGADGGVAPVVRLDPKLLAENGWSKLIFMVSTNDYGLLSCKTTSLLTTKCAADEAENTSWLIMWASDEPVDGDKGSYSKKDSLVLEKSYDRNVKPVVRYDFAPVHASMVAVTSYEVKKDPSDGTCYLAPTEDWPFKYEVKDGWDEFPIPVNIARLPIAEHVGININWNAIKNAVPPDSVQSKMLKELRKNPNLITIPQIACTAVPTLAKLSNIEFNYQNHPQFPLFTPTVLNLDEKDMTIVARADSYRCHNFAAYGMNGIDAKPVVVCDKDNSTHYFSFKSGEIRVDLQSEKMHDVVYILYMIWGVKTFSQEQESDDEPMMSVSSGSTPEKQHELFKCPVKCSKVKNCLLWFIIARDAFGTWSLVNLRTSIWVDPPKDYRPDKKNEQTGLNELEHACLRDFMKVTRAVFNHTGD